MFGSLHERTDSHDLTVRLRRGVDSFELLVIATGSNPPTRTGKQRNNDLWFDAPEH